MKFLNVADYSADKLSATRAVLGPIFLITTIFLTACALHQSTPLPATSKTLGNIPEISPPKPVLALPKAITPTDLSVAKQTIARESQENLAMANAQEWKAKIKHWLPKKVIDKQGWAEDIYAALDTQKIRLNQSNICAAMAIIEQESSFQAEPQVAGLPKIVRKELDTRREKYHIPKWVLENALNSNSRNGKTYLQRINTLKTENDINHLYDDILDELPLGKQLLQGYNPVHTGGPMQVSLNFAKENIAQKPYPFTIQKSLRDELFSRKGGVYFGVAHLLNYRTNYNSMLYRFADFNAGQYASRNADFQRVVAKIAHKNLNLDGDLLSYDGDNKPQASDLEKALWTITNLLEINQTDIRRDLMLEKTYQFAETPLFKKVYSIVKIKGIQSDFAFMPKIKLNSPKITRKLTTEWFANRVYERYENCQSL